MGVTWIEIIYECYIIALELACFLTGCLLVRKNWPLAYKLLVLLTGLTLLDDTTTIIMRNYNIGNFWLYTLFLPIECFFIVYAFYRGAWNSGGKWLNAVLLVCLPVCIGLSYYYHPSLNGMMLLEGTFCLCLELIAASCCLIGVLLNKNGMPLFQQPLFWLSCGMLIYSSIFILIHALLDFGMYVQLYRFYPIFGTIVNTAMYGGFIACFICCHREGLRQRGFGDPFHQKAPA